MREQIIEKILQNKIIAIVRGLETRHLLPLVQALHTGGISLVEVTFNQKKPDSWKDTCNGIRDKVELVDENNPDVYEALAIKYLNINCSVMSPNQSRLDYIREMVKEYNIDGVIEIVLQSCHTFDIEAHYVKRLVTEKLDKAYLNIETDYSQGPAEHPSGCLPGDH